MLTRWSGDLAKSVSKCLPLLSATRGNKNCWKAPGLPHKIYHPHVQEPERIAPKLVAKLDGPAKYVPKDYWHQQYVESLRSGEYLGQDWPYNFLGSSFWNARRYNVEYNPIPADMSPMTGVMFYSRLNVWACEWTENGTHRIRWFRGQFGFARARQAAEGFRASLEAQGRVDNMRTDRQIREQELAKAPERKLRKRKFAIQDWRARGNRGSRSSNRGPVIRRLIKRGLYGNPAPLYGTPEYVKNVRKEKVVDWKPKYGTGPTM